MAKKNKENLKGMKKDELNKKLADLRSALSSVLFKGAGAKVKNVKEISGMKKNIARVLTEINKNNNK